MIFRSRVFVVLTMVFFANAVLAQQSKHVLLISIDGFRPDFYKNANWDVPNIMRLKAGGVWADKNFSVFPSVTYPSHTTVVTGALPGKHGIYYNAPFEAEPERWYWEESLIKVPTLWDAVRSAGLTSGSVMWPVTVGAPIDYNIPVKRPDGDEDSDQLSVTKPFITPQSMIDGMAKSLGGLSQNDFKYDQVDITIGRAASHIIRTYKPNLMAVHFINLDHMQHESGMNGPGVREALHTIDSMVNVLVMALKESGMYESTDIIITGDHGFADVSKSFSPNVVLAKAGLIGKEQWTAKFQSTGGSAFLYLRNRNDKALLNKIRSMLKALPSEQKKTFRIIERPELDKLGANPEIVMALAMQNGASCNNNMEGNALATKKKPNGSHGQYPYMDGMETGFIAFGPNIKSGAHINTISLKDISPLVSKLLNLNFKAPDGKLVPGILK